LSDFLYPGGVAVIKSVVVASSKQVTKRGPIARAKDRLVAGLAERRERIRERPVLNTAYRISVGVVGTVVLAGGIVAIPYPGPGWLIVFAGLAILASEFVWAHHVLRFVKTRYDKFMKWVSRAGLAVQVAFGVFTCAIVLVTLWLLDALNLVAGWVGIHWDWLASPLF
jgi:uncharacterized protein (TIGR02611 family)